MWIHQLCHHFFCVDGYERNDADVYFRAVSNEWSEPYLLQRRLPYRLLRTTRGLCLPNISISLLNSNSHRASYLGLIARHTCNPFTHTHTYNSHLHTLLLCEVLICPGCHLWALLTVCVTTVWSWTVIPFRIVYWTLILAVCLDSLPDSRLCSSPVSITLFTGIYSARLTILNKSCKWIQLSLMLHNNTTMVYTFAMNSRLWVKHTPEGCEISAI